MKIMRPAGAIGIVASAALVLGACGSDPAATKPQGSGAQAAPSGTADVQCGGKSPLSAEGSSAQKTAIDIFVQAYAAKCSGQKVNYNPSGSGAGVKQFNGNQVDFAGSDSPLKDGEEAEKAKARCGADAWNLPLVIGPVAVAYKLEGVDKLTLTPEVTAKIFNGGITKWNDPAIKAVKGNESVNLPDKAIQVISRTDESGTTDNFQKYLKVASKGAWTQGDGKKFNGGVGNGAEKSNGVANAVKSTDGAITYVEASFAKDGLKSALIDSGSGGVELTAANVAKALDAAKFKKEGTNDLALDLDSIYSSNVAGAYPVILATYEIACSKYADAEVGKAVKAFLTVAATDGQKPLADKGYVPIPQSLQDKVLTAVKAIA
ncbi:phosphate ABC transporter substrate-binding protein PstS [Amycolatopsis regifaucium]|uniref:Phosphate-binding protein n=1 Tax=Amycolatopsis regifaucium TaxID=546365 RepID=A0A154MLL1_9PSEU|nr:phosphate ABC transporter substrate-binding protein PstS [Amycolatopsis regifaucium]KZB85192.1 phosphate-binding protein [Amycolatopsis regifaucium]OKA04217.1 phosphate ABC transporter substrate-binding protein PstS [Amycolatopsis regifaucium]SFH90860.1 phosphate transport system substrate-binding protein [Amycolatopsis regifaucium]